MKNNKWLLIGVIASLSVFAIGISYAFFHANILGNDTAIANKVQAGTMELTFTDDNVINIENGQPGDSDSKTFTVENTGTLDDTYTYNIKLTELNVTFQKKDLKYSLVEYDDDTFENEKAGGIKVSGFINKDTVNKDNEMYLALNITRPEKKQKHYYKLTVTFENLDEPQDYNQEAIFTGKINVDDKTGAKLYEIPPNAPDLMQGLIPVTIAGDGTIKVADGTKSDWYDYSNHVWANAVLVSSEKYADLTSNNQVKQDKVGTTLNLETDILQMYVWIPRFKYQLFNVAGTSKVTEQMINIEFESDTATTGDVTCKYTQSTGTINENCTKQDGTAAANGDWYTHPAFTFKGTLEESGTELTGIWVGKFESSGTYTSSGNTVTDLKIIPNVSSLRNLQVAYMFQGVRDLEEKHSATYSINPDEIDTHMMKNMEWGAVAYLTQSKYGRFNSDGGAITDGAEVWINNDQNYTTGCSGNSVSAGSTTCTDNFKWNMGGIHASTTNNVSGVYDMSGGAYEYVMGNMVDQSGNFYSSSARFAYSSGLSVPNPAAKYYDMYTYGTSSSDITRGHLGDATKETRSWYSDYAYFPYSSNSWSKRGGSYHVGTNAGVWYSSYDNGRADSYYSFRVVLSRST